MAKHALEESLTEELKNLESRPVESVDLEELERDLDDQIRESLHKRRSTVPEKRHQSFQFDPQGRIVAASSVPKNLRPRTERAGRLRRQTGEISEGYCTAIAFLATQLAICHPVYLVFRCLRW